MVVSTCFLHAAVFHSEASGYNYGKPKHKKEELNTMWFSFILGEWSKIHHQAKKKEWNHHTNSVLTAVVSLILP